MAGIAPFPEDILVAVVDGLKGFPEAIEAVFPQTMTQTCIVHLIRNSLELLSWKDRKTVMPALRAIYQAPAAEAAEAALSGFEDTPGKRHPTIAPLWRRAYVVPFFGFPPAIRRMIYTTNAVESLNRGLRKALKAPGSFPTDEAALKLLFLAIGPRTYLHGRSDTPHSRVLCVLCGPHSLSLC
jgi:putative transposase